ncbi:MAG: phosphatidylserine decarboxylase family protein [Acidimicrobiia bacterium]|nr:phosphatidylserine decarboxylase family protein [Acidimicrobiia bacterium]
MLIDPAGRPFVIGAAVAALALGAWGGWWMSVPGLLLVALFLFFFRDPHRGAPGVSKQTVVSPADGRVLIAGDAVSETLPDGEWRQVSIFLSPLDVHVNRMPLGGRVTRVSRHRGRYLPAYRRDAGDLNEYAEVHLDHDGQTVIVRQVVGLLARRVVCRAAAGDEFTAGQRYGVMKFGSRMDVFLPAGSAILVSPGDRVTGGVTPIATLAVAD